MLADLEDPSQIILVLARSDSDQQSVQFLLRTTKGSLLCKAQPYDNHPGDVENRDCSRRHVPMILSVGMSVAKTCA